MGVPVLHPILIIGLGGTGQWVACHVLKELMELYNLKKPGDLDPRVQILAIDTDFQSVARVDVGLRSADGGVAVGSLQLPGTMVLPLGANVHAYVESIARGQYPETASWFDARWFLEQPNNNVLLNLVNGAGQFRPLGRIAVPFNLDLAGGSLCNALQKAITKIRQADPIQSLTVCITGSLCGGTGAGMMVDVAHLVQSIAAPLTVNIQGYLVLPNAFEGTVPPAPDNGAAIRQRAFAAMRELRRFSREVRFDLGYPMYYAGADKAQDPILRGRVKNTLFSMLHYFDGGLVRYGRDRDGNEAPIGWAKVEHGIAPLIAEAILLWVDGSTSAELLSHTTNLTAVMVSKVAAGKLDPKAAVAGGMGAFSLQLPLMHFQEEWACDLGREVLKKFLGVPEEGGEDRTTKTITRLREDWAGGASGISGRQAAHRDWPYGAIGGMGLDGLEKDILEIGIEVRKGTESQARCVRDLMMRTREVWEQILGPAMGGSGIDRELSAIFLSRAQKATEPRSLLKRLTRIVPVKDIAATRFSRDAGKAERNQAQMGAPGIMPSVAEFLDQQLGRIDPRTHARGGSDREPQGQHTEMLRAFGEVKVNHFRETLRAWVTEALNSTLDPTRATCEDALSSIRNRAGKLGYTLAFLEELTEIMDASASVLAQLESWYLGHVIFLRCMSDNDRLTVPSRQTTYLKRQQEILDAECTYLALHVTRWAAGQMARYASSARESLQTWKVTLTQTVYPAVWQGQEQARIGLSELEKLSAVRQIVNLPEMKQERYRYSAEEKNNAVGEILNDLRWRVSFEEAFDAEQPNYHPAFKINLQLNGQDLTVDSAANAYLQRCRVVFAAAREHETLLGWLAAYYNNDGSEARNVTTLARELSKRCGVALRCEDGAVPYRFVCVRAHLRNNVEAEWLNSLVTNLTQMDRADAAYSFTIPSSDPFRLTILTFDELIDVEKLTAYVEGRDGTGGRGGYLSLPARSDSTSLSRQVLHVFAAERNAAIYEERLGYLLPDRIVPLLEDRNRFRLFVQAWAYGQVADGQEILLNTVQLPDDAGERYGGQWIRRLTTGPFDEDIDEVTHEPLPAQQRWLTAPSSDRPSLITTAETFLLGGVDRWQEQNDERTIEVERVQQEVARRRAWLARATARSDNNRALWALVDQISDGAQREQHEQDMLDFEHLQRLQVRLSQQVLPQAEREILDWRPTQEQNPYDRFSGAAERAEMTLDVDLLKLIRVSIADEMKHIRGTLIRLVPEPERW